MSRRNSTVIAAAVLVALVVLVSVVLVIVHMRQDSTLPSAIAQQSWELDAFTFDGQSQALVPGATITLSFHTQSQEVSGSNGCNAYGATYSVSQSQNRFRLSALRQTLIACLKPGVGEQEAHYMTALPLITTYHLDQSGLTLRDDAGRYVLHYTATTS